MTKAIRFHETGGADVLKLEDVDVGEPGAGQARVRHSYIAVNFIDIYFRTGRYPLALPNGLGSGTPLIQYGSHGGPDGKGVAMVGECGQHFLRAASDLATAVTYDFLAYFGLVDKDPATPPPEPQRRFQLLQTDVIKSEDFAFVRPVIGFETFAKGELIATNGDEEIRALCDDCTIFMPAQRTIVGREAVYLTKPL